MEENKGMFVKQEKYLESGIHVGTKFKTNDMKKFIFRVRPDKLNIIDLKQIDERLRNAINILKRYDPKDVLIVASRVYSGNAAEKCSKLVGFDLIKGRFIPGTMTNLSIKNFKEPKILFVCDPKGEKEAINEAVKMNIPVIALCDTDNDTKFIDYIIPANNKGRKSLALIFYIITREMMLAQGKIKSYDEFPYNVSYFAEIDLKE